MLNALLVQLVELDVQMPAARKRASPLMEQREKVLSRSWESPHLQDVKSVKARVVGVLAL